MFYAHFVLSKKGPFSRIWLAAHWDKKLTRAHVFETNINSSVEAILEPKLKMALRTSGHLLLGVVRIYSRKAKYLLADCNEIYVKIKTSFRPGAVDLPDDTNREAALAAITLPETIHDYEATMADLTAINLNTMNINQSRPEDITMREDFGDVNLGRVDDDFGEGAFEELPSREILRGSEGYDSVYGRATDTTGRYSVRESDRPSIRPDIDGDDTIIGNKDKSEKLSSGHTPAADFGLDDNDLPKTTYDDDSDSNFGGDIETSLFFEDPATQNQIDTLTAGLIIPGDTTNITYTGGAIEKGALTANMAAEVMDALRSKSSINDQMPSSISITRNSTSRDNTTLISNELEAFALLPVDVPATVEHRRATKRKRRLIIDELKSIPSELMKTQMQDTSEIVAQLDLAPPTKRLMYMKETGGLDKLFSLPGRAIPSRILQRVFSRNLRSFPVPNNNHRSVESSCLVDATSADGNASRPHLIFRLSSSTAGNTTMEEQLLSAAATPRDALCHSGFPIGPNTIQNRDGFELDAIPEETIQGTQSYSFTPSHHGEKALGMAEKTLTELHDPFLATTSRPTDVPGHHGDHGVHSDDDLDDDNGFPLDTLAPPSVLSEASQGMLLEHDLDTRRSYHGLSHLAAGLKEDDEDTLPAVPSVEHHYHIKGLETGAEVDEEEEIEEERRLEKRSKDMLRRLRSHTTQFGWDECGISLLGMCEGNTKKQAASKFYTMLLLRKQGSVELFQEGPYSDIRVCRGPAFVGPSEV